jgi:predicted amidohydrolase
MTVARLGLVQMVSQPLDRAANLKHIDERLAAIAGKVDIAVFPECADIGYVPDAEEWLGMAAPIPGPSVIALRESARRHGVAVICGVLEEDAALRGVYYSSAVAIDAAGTLQGVYRKSHLYPKEHAWFKAGPDLPVFELAGLRVGVAICFEAAIPQIFSELAAKGAELVVNPSAVPVGFDDVQDLRTPARALDNQIFVAAVNRGGAEGGVVYCGGSQLCNPKGRVLAKAGGGEETVISTIDTDEIVPERLKEPVFRALRPELYRMSVQASGVES